MFLAEPTFANKALISLSFLETFIYLILLIIIDLCVLWGTSFKFIDTSDTA